MTPKYSKLVMKEKHFFYISIFLASGFLVFFKGVLLLLSRCSLKM